MRTTPSGAAEPRLATRCDEDAACGRCARCATLRVCRATRMVSGTGGIAGEPSAAAEVDAGPCDARGQCPEERCITHRRREPTKPTSASHPRTHAWTRRPDRLSALGRISGSTSSACALARADRSAGSGLVVALAALSMLGGSLRRVTSVAPAAALLFTLASGCGSEAATPGPLRPTAPPLGPTAPAPPARAIEVPAEIPVATEGRAALRTLVNAQYFGGWAVGVAATPSEVVRAYRTLLADPHAREGLAFAVEHGTPAGSLMALAGLYSVDPERFRAELPRFRARSEPVAVLTSGCAPGGDLVPVALVVEDPRAVRLEGPGDDLLAWSRRNPTGQIEAFDIVGGGYPAVVRGPAAR